MEKKLVVVQKSVNAITKDCANPFHKSRYASLGAILEALLPALNDQGLFLTQPVGHDESGLWFVETIVRDSSAPSESLNLGRVPVVNSKGDAQGLGAAITYARRFGLVSAFSLWAEDDDGETACGRPSRQTPAPKAKAVEPPPAAKEEVKEVKTAAPQASAPQTVSEPAPAADVAPFDYANNAHRALLAKAAKASGVSPAKLGAARAWFESGEWKNAGLTADTDVLAAKIREVAK